MSTGHARRQGGRRRIGGLAYVEVLVALVLVASALVPALEALQSSVRGGPVLTSAAGRDALLRAKMEEVLSLPFETLNAETFLAGGNTTVSVSSALSDAAGADRRVVILYRSDGSALSAADTGLVRVRVAYEAGGLALETMKSRWW
ncbi:hypothetical protein [Sphaerotilus microaerophilus]|uniref:Prepilin-type N-terminal cleavage/methylation domain-containing protein n=1 Tax=Sphaerotilus microaerophilus TaxID=2914710 RepID=A0ABM7YK69_9BURK|nr:hypothetical protein [Sphaerotilus sp. FB-5]BDI04694.1 hypothetical protein CATMQ487_16640 [Sphaerotilus sp. FB-5]